MIDFFVNNNNDNNNNNVNNNQDICHRGQVQGVIPNSGNHTVKHEWGPLFPRIFKYYGSGPVDNSLNSFKMFCLPCTKCAMSSSGVQDGSITQDPAISTQKGLLNLKKFETGFNTSLDEAMANLFADLL
jgi:hypothetical protein